MSIDTYPGLIYDQIRRPRSPSQSRQSHTFFIAEVYDGSVSKNHFAANSNDTTSCE